MVNDRGFRSAMARHGAALIQRRSKGALIAFATDLKRPLSMTPSTQNAPEDGDARVRLFVAWRRAATFLTLADCRECVPAHDPFLTFYSL